MARTKGSKNKPKPVRYVAVYETDGFDWMSYNRLSEMKTFSSLTEIDRWINKSGMEIDRSTLRIFQVDRELEVGITLEIR